MAGAPVAQIALLRGINVGGKSMVSMADLRTMLTDLGFTNPRSLLQSGNLVFGSTAATGTKLEKLLETELGKRCGRPIDFMVRTTKEWQAAIDHNPFPDAAKNDPAHLLVLFLKEAVDASAVKALQAAIKGREIVKGAGKQVYMVYPDGIGTSKVTNAVIEKHLDARATGRNWNTVLKLAALAQTE